MARPRSRQPTPAELEILKILWEQGPLTVRGVMEHQDTHPQRAYTTVMTLLNIMWQKKLLRRRPRGKAYEYAAVTDRQRTSSGMLRDLLDRVYEGSASALVAHLLSHGRPSAEDLEEIRRLIAEHPDTKGVN